MSSPKPSRYPIRVTAVAALASLLLATILTNYLRFHPHQPFAKYLDGAIWFLLACSTAGFSFAAWFPPPLNPNQKIPSFLRQLILIGLWVPRLAGPPLSIVFLYYAIMSFTGT